MAEILEYHFLSRRKLEGRQQQGDGLGVSPLQCLTRIKLMTIHRQGTLQWRYLLERCNQWCLESKRTVFIFHNVISLPRWHSTMQREFHDPTRPMLKSEGQGCACGFLSIMGFHCRRLIFTSSHEGCRGHWQDWNNSGQSGVNKMQWVSLWPLYALPYGFDQSKRLSYSTFKRHAQPVCWLWIIANFPLSLSTLFKPSPDLLGEGVTYAQVWNVSSKSAQPPQWSDDPAPSLRAMHEASGRL